MTFNQFRSLVIKEVRKVFPKAKIMSCSNNLEGPGVYFYFKFPFVGCSHKKWMSKIRKLRIILSKYQVRTKDIPFNAMEGYEDGTGYCFIAIDPTSVDSINVKSLINECIFVLENFAKMDRENCNLDEVACERGVASDHTFIDSRDFRRANILYDKLKKLR